MAIDEKKILELSKKEFFKTTGKKSSDYSFKEIKVSVGRPNYVMSTFAEKVPKEAEFVVNYQAKYTSDYFQSATGIALIPKKK